MNDELQQPPSNEPVKSDGCWAYLNYHEGEENVIVGSVAGLRILRDHIDKAISDGETDISEPDVEFFGVRVTDQRRANNPPGSTFLGIGCAVLLFSVLGLAIVGAYYVLSGPPNP